MLMSGRIIPTILGRGGDFQEWGHYPLFGLLWWALELSWRLWVCRLAYANVLQGAYNEAQGLLEVKSSTILGLIGSNQFLLYPQQLCHSFNGYALSPSFLSQSQQGKASLFRKGPFPVLKAFT